jgi:hypothetical protein
LTKYYSIIKTTDADDDGKINNTGIIKITAHVKEKMCRALQDIKSMPRSTLNRFGALLYSYYYDQLIERLYELLSMIVPESGNIVIACSFITEPVTIRIVAGGAYIQVDRVAVYQTDTGESDLFCCPCNCFTSDRIAVLVIAYNVCCNTAGMRIISVTAYCNGTIGITITGSYDDLRAVQLGKELFQLVDEVLVDRVSSTAALAGKFT